VSPSRRTFLAGASVGAASLAGCTAPFERSRTRIGEVVLLNMDDVSHSVRVRIRSDGTALFEATVDVPPSDAEQPVLTREDGLPTAAREYTVAATLDGGSDAIERTYPTKGGDCYSVTVRVGTDGAFRDMPSEPAFEGCE
jgi:hypothetical protein